MMYRSVEADLQTPAPLGGGIARGLDVVVPQHARFRRCQVCAGRILPRVPESLELEYVLASVRRPSTGFRFGLVEGSTPETCCGEAGENCGRRATQGCVRWPSMGNSWFVCRSTPVLM